MNHRLKRPHKLIILAVLFAVLVLPERSIRGEDALFLRQVAPILEQNCLRCHGKKTARGGLSLATAEDMRAGSDSGPVVVSGKPIESLLVHVVSGDKPKMPKKARPLTKAQVAILEKWIAEGAKWPKNHVLREPSDDKKSGGRCGR